MKTPASASMTAHRAETQRKYKKEKKKRRKIRKAEKKRELEQKRHENQELAGTTEKPPKPTKWRRITDCKKAVDRPVDEDKINELLERRTKAKASKEYAVADGIMEQLVELEIVYDDARKEWHTRELGGVGGKKKKQKDKDKAPAATVNHIESMDDFNAMLETSKSQACIVDFTATWCPPCKMIAPIFEGLAKEHASSVRFFKADVDQADEVAEKCRIQAMPTFQVFRKGEKVDQMDGADPDGLKKLLEKHS